MGRYAGPVVGSGVVHDKTSGLCCRIRRASARGDLTVSQTRVTAQQPRSAVLPLRPSCPSASGLQLDALDKTADACTDFYQFACGGWIAKNPVPADRSGCGRFDELQERNNDTLHTHPRGRGGRTRPGVEEDRRLLRVVHGRDGDRRQGRRAARSAAEEDRRAVERQRPRAAGRRAAHDRRQRVLPASARRPTSRTRRSRWRSPTRAGSACPTATTTSRTMRSRWSCASSTSSTSAKMSALLGAAGDQATAAGAAGDDDRDRARQGRARRRLAPRPEQGLPQDDDRRAAGADAAVPVDALLQRHRRAADLRAQRRRARLLQGVRPARGGDAARRDQGLPALAGRARLGRRSSRSRSSTRTSASTARR